jgi:hypothetical protein
MQLVFHKPQLANESAICGCKNTVSGRAVHCVNIHIYIVQ